MQASGESRGDPITDPTLPLRNVPLPQGEVESEDNLASLRDWTQHLLRKRANPGRALAEFTAIAGRQIPGYIRFHITPPVVRTIF